MSKINKYFDSVVEHPELYEWELGKYVEYMFYGDDESSKYQVLSIKYKKLIDLGCGAGEFLAYAKDFFKDVLGIDNNPVAIKLCKAKNIPAILVDATDTKLKASSFDVVRAMNLIEHVPDIEKLILEARRLLKKDGYLVLHAPSQWSTLYPVTNFWDDYTHVRPISKHGLERLTKDTGFEIVYLTGYTLGRNQLESVIGKIISRVFPFSWFMIGKKSSK